MLSARAFDGHFGATLDYIRSHPDAPEWSPWAPYASSDAGWTSPPIFPGPYVFAVQGRDAQGVVEEELDESRNVRRVRVRYRTGGPILEVTGI